QTVCFVELGEKTVVYKPKSLKIDAAFQKMISWLNERVDVELPTLALLDLREHGWVEFVPAIEARDEKEVSDAFLRMGMLLALIQLCGASDMHYENIIFSGAKPYLIDLETLLTPRLELHASDLGGWQYKAMAAWPVLETGYLGRRSSGQYDASAA